MRDMLIRCIQCNEVLHITDWDNHPQYVWDGGGDGIKEIEKDDRKDFAQRHTGHAIEELTPLTPPLSDKIYTEPIKTSYFEATNGAKRFLIKRWRDTINNPFVYEIVNGTIEIRYGKAQVQTEAIKKQIISENTLHFSERELDIFINNVQKEVESLDLERLEVSAEGDTPLTSYCKLPYECVERILIRCQSHWDQRQLRQLKDFILSNSDYNDVMTVVVEKAFRITGESEQDGISRKASYPFKDFSVSHP